MSRAWLVAACLLATSVAQADAPARAVPADPERQLQAIRQALIDTTVAAPVRVQSFAWIDAEGRLHESAQFTSDTRVRGVRVQSYLDDPSAPAPQARVDVAPQPLPLPTGTGPRAATDPQQCLADQRRWRLGLHVEVALAPDLDVLHPGAAQRLAAGLAQAFVRAAHESQRWIAQRRPYQPVSAYERALVGREADRSDWLLRIELAGLEGQGVEARFELARVQEPTAARRLRLRLPAGQLRAADLSLLMAQAVQALDQQVACEPVHFSVESSGPSLLLRGGAANGLKAGDRLLLVERQYLPSRLLEPGALRSAGIVQVDMAGTDGAALRWLAGPRPEKAGDWVALPL